jgi:asparagine synthase (glutamine-hydrolysing)
MFAFAIWDEPKRTLLLARDRLGVKPLFYRATGQSLAFASELKALLRLPEVERSVDPLAIHDYLSYQYVPSPRSIFRGIRKLPPAHMLVCRDGVVRVRRYWQLSYLPKRHVAGAADERSLEHELIERLTDAVRCRLIADVPLGAFLSGGVDSSAVVALMCRLAQGRVRTFSIGFPEQSHDERPAARLVARHLGTEHHEYVMESNAFERVPELVRHYDEPYADASALPTFVLSRLARAHVKVVLTGDAGDENFAGYDRHRANDLAAHLQPVGQLVRMPWLKSALDTLPSGHDARDPRWRFKRFVEHLALPAAARNAAWLSQFSAAEKAALYTPEFAHEVRDVDSLDLVYARYRESGSADVLDATLYADVTTYLPDALLVKADIATMAHALEARSPFLDHRFMEFAARLPSSLKLRHGVSKWILKRALRGLLPPGILGAPKRGFDPPVGQWLNGPLREVARELLLGERSRARGIFRPEAVRRLLEEHASGSKNRAGRLWTLMMLEMWQREVADRAPGWSGELSGSARSSA